MKSGSSINEILVTSFRANDSAELKTFGPSATPPASGTATSKLSEDYSAVDVLAWKDGSNIYYYAAGYTDSGKKIPMNNEYLYDGMFNYCYGLKSIDLSGFDTSQVTCMREMFDGCSRLTSLYVSNFDTSKVSYMSSMFSDCSGLTSLYVSNFDTSNVTSMEYMFYSCSSLTSLDPGNFDTGKVTNMRFMFYDCSSLGTIYASSSFVTTGVGAYCDNYMFYWCTSLVGGAGTTYSSGSTGKDRARIDGGSSARGYFTAR